MHGGHEDAVLECRKTEIERLEKIRIAGIRHEGLAILIEYLEWRKSITPVTIM